MAIHKIDGKKCKEIIDKLILKQINKGENKMNKFLKWLIAALFALMIIIMIAVNVRAESDWKLSANIYKTVASDVESIVQSGSGLQISLHRKSLYFYISKDVNQVRFAGQSGPDINLWSAGIGMKRKIRYLTLSLDVGWYEPRFSKMGEPQPYPDTPFAEGLCRYLNKYLMPDDGYPAWDYYSYNLQGAIGGKLGLSFEYPITDWMSFNMTTGYRYLKLLENIQGRNYPGNDPYPGYWTVRYERDFSGWMIGGSFVVEF